jgi:hypothetical protein
MQLKAGLAMGLRVKTILRYLQAKGLGKWSALAGMRTIPNRQRSASSQIDGSRFQRLHLNLHPAGTQQGYTHTTQNGTENLLHNTIPL